MADNKDLPVAKAMPPKRAIVIDPTVLGVGAVVALLGVGLLAVFLWMIPSAAAREAVSACRGLHALDPLDRQPIQTQQGMRMEPNEHGSAVLCPGGKPCNLPVVAPDFTAVDNNGKPVRLSDFRGKVVLLNFWASWCGVCKTEKPSLAAMAGDLATNDFVVIALASDHTWADALLGLVHSLAPGTPLGHSGKDGEVTMADAIEAYRNGLPGGVPFKVFLDPPDDDGTIGAITKAWGITAVPESVLIDRRGNIRAYFVNKRDWESPVAQTCLRSVIDE